MHAASTATRSRKSFGDFFSPPDDPALPVLSELLWSDVLCEAFETSLDKQFRAVKRRPMVILLTKYLENTLLVFYV